MSLLVRKLLTSLLVFLTLIFSFIFISYAWFDNNFYLNSDALGRARIGYTSYFAGGTGIDTDPFIIAEPEHLSNLAYLQNLGKFNNVSSPYYFKVAHPTTGDRIDIDFSAYGSIPPIGDHIYPFTGIFDGNYSNLKYLTIDGIGKQDIGIFGYVNADDSFTEGATSLKNLFIEEAVIISNPDPSEVTIDFHGHNESILNRATGYIVGHLGYNSTIKNVFVIAPTINSGLNNDLNRSQYGLIGYNEADMGVTAGSPRSAYQFTLEANSAYASLSYAKSQYGTYYVNGSGTITLNDVLTDDLILVGKNLFRQNVPVTYSLSTLKISPTANDPDPMYLYDQIVEDYDNNVPGAAIIGTQNSQYSRQNIDLVGRQEIQGSAGSRSFNFAPFAKTLVLPKIGTQFIPTDYAATFILYVRPTNNPLNLGTVNATYQNPKPAYYTGFDQNGLYRGGEIGDPDADITTSPIANSGQDSTMTVNQALAAVVRDGNGEMLVVDPSNPATLPDFYVFVIGMNNGQTNLSTISFSYEPQALVEDSLSSVQEIDFIDSSWISNIIAALADDEDELIYEFSFLNFGYDLAANQTIDVETIRLPDGTFVFNISYSTPQGYLFYFDILNLYGIPVYVYINNDPNYLYYGSNNIIEITMYYDQTSVYAHDT